MVTQPAYLSNLKNYARSRLRNDTEIDASVADFSAESDRGAIILAATNIEDALGDRILQYLPGLQGDEPTRKRMFEQDGQIASFSKRIELAYALGIIDREYRKKIDLVREIRNACAHSRKPISLKQIELREACEAAMPDIMPHLKDATPLLIRNAFTVKCLFIAHYVMTGEKIEGKEAALKHYSDLVKSSERGDF